MAKGAVIVVSSHVARGSVGNRAMVFALERLGFTVWAVPTILLPHHPGHGRAERIVTDETGFAQLLQTLIQDKRGAEVNGVISGYLASAGQAQAVAALVQAVKAEQPQALYLCDTVIGDESGLYVAEELAAAVRDALLPLADAATPNAFECAWLVGKTFSADADLVALARALPPPVALVTSAPALMRGHVGNLLVTKESAMLFEHPALPTAAKGTGDLLAALLLARRLEGHDWAKAAEMAISSVFEIVGGTAKAGADELILPEFQQAIVAPRAPISVRRMDARGAEKKINEGSTWVAGVDGCPCGWIAVFIDARGKEPPRVRAFGRIAEIVTATEAPLRVAVDMPIGLPDRIEGAGRAAEIAVRRHLGERQSSVFSVPCRAAVMCDTYLQACEMARVSSNPPRAVTRQSFALFNKIRELDELLTPELAEWIIETHPEVAFRELAGGTPMHLPKKVKGRPHPPGLEERIALLERHGFASAFLNQRVGRGVGADDFVDACVAALVAKRHLEGVAVSYPDPPGRDSRGLPIAIWA